MILQTCQVLRQRADRPGRGGCGFPLQGLTTAGIRCSWFEITFTRLLQFTRQIAVVDLPCSHKLPTGSIVTKVIIFKSISEARIFWKARFYFGKALF